MIKFIFFLDQDTPVSLPCDFDFILPLINPLVEVTSFNISDTLQPQLYLHKSYFSSNFLFHLEGKTMYAWKETVQRWNSFHKT